MAVQLSLDEAAAQFNEDAIIGKTELTDCAQTKVRHVSSTMVKCILRV